MTLTEAPLTLLEAEGLAERVLRELDRRDHNIENLMQIDGLARFYATWLRSTCSSDRERVVADLAGLRDHPARPHACSWNFEDWPCADARRYSDGLRRTAALYGTADV